MAYATYKKSWVEESLASRAQRLAQPTQTLAQEVRKFYEAKAAKVRGEILDAELEGL